jgi:hypothetical protein
MDGERLDLTRPRSVGELLATTLRLFFAHAGLFLSLTLLVVAPVVVLVDGVWGRALWGGADAHAPAGADNAFTLLTIFVIPPLVTGLHAVVARELGAGGVPSVRGALHDAGPRLLPAIVTVAVATIGVMIGLLLLVLPGIWMSVRWYFGAQVAVLEGVPPQQALRRSAHLTEGRWWSTAGALSAAALTFGLAAAIATVGAGAVHDGVAYVSLLTVIQAVSLSLTALFGTLLFFSLRARQAAVETLAAA